MMALTVTERVQTLQEKRTKARNDLLQERYRKILPTGQSSSWKCRRRCCSPGHVGEQEKKMAAHYLKRDWAMREQDCQQQRELSEWLLNMMASRQ